MAKIRVFYVDEDPDEAESAKQYLESTEQLEVEVVPPKVDIGETLSDKTADIYILDYLLTGRQPDGSTVAYKGGTLSAAVREQAKDRPVILLTKPEILGPRDKRELLADLRVIDDVMFKSELAKPTSRGRILNELVSLAQGFRTLRSVPAHERSWLRLLQLLGANEDEAYLLGKAAPPLYAGQNAEGWSVSEIASWIRNTILAYPGIVYDSVFTATELRIAETSFQVPDVQEIFGGAKYSGPFAPMDGRWWRDRIWESAMEFAGEVEFAQRFSIVFEERTGLKLDPSVSIVRGESPADAVCYIYHEPVMYKYTAAYQPDNRPPVMDQARVSFKAIQQSNDVQMALVQGIDEEMLARIGEMEL